MRAGGARRRGAGASAGPVARWPRVVDCAPSTSPLCVRGGGRSEGPEPLGRAGVRPHLRGGPVPTVDAFADLLLTPGDTPDGRLSPALRLKAGSKLSAAGIAVVSAGIVLALDANWFAFIAAHHRVRRGRVPVRCPAGGRRLRLHFGQGLPGFTRAAAPTSDRESPASPRDERRRAPSPDWAGRDLRSRPAISARRARHPRPTAHMSRIARECC